MIYRHYATLYFIFAVDEAESELGILDLIQVFVEALDKCFENVCELDLIFHTDKVSCIAVATACRMSVCICCCAVAAIIVCLIVSVLNCFVMLYCCCSIFRLSCVLQIHFILDEIVMGGMVLETSLKEIIKAVNGTVKYQRDTQASSEQKVSITRKVAT